MTVWRIGLIALVLAWFNWTAWPNMQFGLNSVEAWFFWVDEGAHLDTLEQMQDKQTLRLLHQAYTAFYPNLSFLGAWLYSGMQMPIASEAFAFASKAVSLLSMNGVLLLGFVVVYYACGSFGWALLGMGLIAGQRLHLLYATRMHPEALMLLFTVLALYAGMRLLREGKLLHLCWLAAGVGWAIGTKLQVVFLLPWAGLLFLATLWRWRHHRPWFHWLGWIAVATVCGLGALLMATPYQLWNFQDLVQGILVENKIRDYYPALSLWKWTSVVWSELHLGPFFSVMFGIALIGGGYRVLHEWRRQGVAILNDGPSVLYLTQVLWLVIGAGYIVTTYRVFAHRYLIQVHVSFLLIFLVGLYWWMKAKRPFYHKASLILVGILVFGGIQGQWRHTRRDIEQRQKIQNIVEKQRGLPQEFLQYIAADSVIAHTRRVYVPLSVFPNAFALYHDVVQQVLHHPHLDYLIVNRNYRPGMRGHTLLRGSPEVQAQTVQFWEALEADGVQGQFRIVKEYPDLDVTVYQRVFL